MRKLLRQKAKYIMQLTGRKHINKITSDYKGRRLPSFFSVNWKEYAAKTVPQIRKAG